VIYSLILDLLVKNEETQLEQKGELLVQFLEDNAKYNNSVDELEKFLSEQNLQFIVYDQASDQILMSTLNLNIVEGFYNKGYFEDEASDGCGNIQIVNLSRLKKELMLINQDWNLFY